MLTFLMNASENLNFDIKVSLPIMGAYIHLLYKIIIFEHMLMQFKLFRIV